MVPLDTLEQIRERFQFLEAKMASGVQGSEFVNLSREYAELKLLVTGIDAYRASLAARDEAEAMLEDPEMRVLAQEELAKVKGELPILEQRLKIALLPKDAADARPAIVEIRPGTGGEEAALFARDLLRMYQRYAEDRGWKFSMIELSESELGGVKEAVANVEGDGVFARLKFESGVHRVQRVPETESGGRIHTSAATVAVLPEAEAVDVDIQEADIRIDTMRASGSGGQHVNTTDSAVRITHVPSGIVVTSSEKSQHQNRAIAMTRLRAKLYDLERQRQAEERASDRKAKVGSGDRSERIRTYNFPQGRMTDHRIGFTTYRLSEVLGGGLDEVIDALIAADQAERLAEQGL